MHTAQTLKGDMFAVEIDGQPADRQALLDYQPHDRLGIVVTSPLGAIGVSLLLQLAITAFYDVRPARRSVPTYADIYLFHFGGPHGDFSSFDFRPARKEVFVDASGDLLGAINAHAITHLAVPDAEVRQLPQTYKEPEAARDRIRHVFAYSPSGRTAAADVALTALDAAVIGDQMSSLDPGPLLAMMPSFLEGDDAVKLRDSADWIASFKRRLDEVDQADRDRAIAWRRAISRDGLPRETYRRISVNEGLGMLHLP